MSILLSNSVRDFKDRVKFVVSSVEKLKSDESAEIRVSSIYSSTLLIASLFEVFIRTIALEYLKIRIPTRNSIQEVPRGLLIKLCEQTLNVAKNDLGKVTQSSPDYTKAIAQLTLKIKDLFEFFQGDFGKDIFDGVIYNERNMTETQLNDIFKVCGIETVCMKIGTEGNKMKKFYPKIESKGTYNQFSDHLRDFIDLRNEIAHRFDLNFRERYTEFNNDCEMLFAFAEDLEHLLQMELKKIS